MNQKELNEILEKHKKWLNGDQNGERANLSNADLRRANLIGTDLIGANLIGTDLSNADLSNVNLSGANLTFADLSNSDLSNTKLNWINTQELKGQKIISAQVDTSRKNNLISYWADLGIWTTGCFQGTLEELKESIEKTHKDNKFLKDRYYRVIDFILQEAKYDEVEE